MILELLKVDQESYEAMRFDAYMEWCLLMSDGNDRQFQVYLANAAINKWFNNQYSQLEEEFASKVFIQSRLNTKSIRTCYADITNKIYYRFPKPLIKHFKLKTANINK